MLQGARYSLNLSHELLANLRGKGFASRGYTSPPQELTMELHDRRLANVPLEASHFAWAFPLSGVAEARDRDAIAPQTKEEAFALFGGFVYLNANSMVIAVNALAKASRGLCFDGPFPLNSVRRDGCAGRVGSSNHRRGLAAASCHLPCGCSRACSGRACWRSVMHESALANGQQLRSVLLSEARANFATVGEQLAMGVKNYAWLGPGEARGAEDGAAWPHGAFVYLYDDSRTDLDCYFALKESVRAGGTMSGMRSSVYSSYSAGGSPGAFGSPDPRLGAFGSLSPPSLPPAVRQTFSA